MTKKSRKERRLARQAREQKKKDNLKTNKDVRRAWVQAMGQAVISKKWDTGRGKFRYFGKKGEDKYRYITSQKTFRDVSAVWRSFSQFVAEKSEGDDLDDLESILKYANRYLQSCVDKGSSAWTLTMFKNHLGKVFDLPSTAFIAAKPRQRADIKRSRYDVESDKRISQVKHDFFAMVGGATGLRRLEMQAICGTALSPERDEDGFYYFATKGRGGQVRRSPIIARNEEEEQLILALFRQAGNFYVFNNRYNDVQTYAVPKKLDEHSHRAEYARRVYKHYERNVLELPRQQKTFLRKDLRGHVLDKFAELKASQALGYNRVDEFRRSYAYKLVG